VYCKTLKELCGAIQNKRHGMLTSGVVLLHDNAHPLKVLTLEHCWSISTRSCLITLLTTLISLWATITCFPTWRTGCDHNTSTIMRSWWKGSKHGWAHKWQTSLTQAYKNLFPDMKSASIPVVTKLRVSLSIYIIFVYNIYIYIFSVACFLNSSLEVTFWIFLVYI
jgi:hypothetical protein